MRNFRKSGLVRSVLCVALAALLLLGFGCGGGSSEHGDPNANRTVPSDSLTLQVGQDASGKKLLAFGAELDPHFFSYNVGKKGMTDGKSWEVKAEDWDRYVVPRVKEMNLQRIRVMLLPSWFAPEESNYTGKNYTWDSKNMQSLYKVLDLAKAEDIYVNITFWGVDSETEWLVNPDLAGWCVDPAPGREQAFCDLFADAIKHLVNEKKYDCIKEITLFNEPTGIYSSYGNVKGNQYYCELCQLLDETFKAQKIRDKVKFCLSDDTSDSVWLAKTLASLDGIIDIASTHSYAMGNEHTNEQMYENMNAYSFKNFEQVMAEYPDVPHIFGEVGINTGTDTHTVTDALTATRGLTISRVVLNMLNSGSSGASYWVLFNQFYNAVDSRMMNMGLWGFADEGYDCRPVYYAYSLLTRFGINGSDIFPIESADGRVCALALRSPEGKWSYFAVNDSDEDKKISFLNLTKFPSELKRYVYDEANVPTDNKVLASNGNVTADGRVLTDVLKARSFGVWTEL